MKCISCHYEMVDGYELKIKNAAFFAYNALKKDHDERELKASICSHCGKVEFYVDIDRK